MEELKDDCRAEVPADGGKVQSNGLGPTEPSITPKKRGRPKKIPTNLPPPDSPESPSKRGRPACEDKPNQFPLKEIIWFSDPLQKRANRQGTGLFHDPSRGHELAIMNVVEKKDGTLRWSNRVVANKRTGKPLFLYDMVLVSPASMDELGDTLERMGKAIRDKQVEWFGGQRKADESLVEWQEEKAKDTLGDKIRKSNVF